MNILSAGADHIIGASDKIDVTIVMQKANIAGVIPTIHNLFRRCIRSIEILGKN